MRTTLNIDDELLAMVWIDSPSTRQLPFGDFAYDGEVLCHPFVIGAVACGNL